ncbi:MAG TPA: sugar kinase [Elusimicrobia bacterium]|jgi:sugar/nucleoside kinase (ribokinase family)|nr:sugar kinase [Elusimicrobiota bacterium]
MSKDILVVGSVALDTVKTPFGEVEEALGGSAVYFSLAASFFTKIKLVAVVGEDFPDRHAKLLESRGIDLRGLEKIPGKTFRWKGEYSYNLNEAKTLETQLNVFENFQPHLPEDYKNTGFIFLANIDPQLQKRVLEQVKKPSLVVCDTMNYWIENKPEQLRKTLKKVDILVINEAETRQFSSEVNLVKAARKILSLGPRAILVKRGEYGALCFTKNSIFSAPGYPLEFVYDPTGAGDSFAGGFLGYLAKMGNLSERNIRRAIIFGSVMASFDVEDFSIQRFKTLTLTEIEQRFGAFKDLTHFESL